MYCFSFSQFILFSILKSGYQLDILFFVISLYIYCISIYYSCCFIEKHDFQSYLFDCFSTNLFHQIPFTRRLDKHKRDLFNPKCGNNWSIDSHC